MQVNAGQVLPVCHFQVTTNAKQTAPASVDFRMPSDGLLLGQVKGCCSPECPGPSHTDVAVSDCQHSQLDRPCRDAPSRLLWRFNICFALISYRLERDCDDCKMSTHTCKLDSASSLSHWPKKAHLSHQFDWPAHNMHVFAYDCKLLTNSHGLYRK